MFYKHRRLLPPLLLQRGVSSTTRAAATATCSSPMFMKRLPNSISQLTKNINSDIQFFWGFNLFKRAQNLLNNHRKYTNLLFVNLKNRSLNLLEISKFDFDVFGILIIWDLWIIHIFRCLVSHAEVIPSCQPSQPSCPRPAQSWHCSFCEFGSCKSKVD